MKRWTIFFAIAAIALLPMGCGDDDGSSDTGAGDGSIDAGGDSGGGDTGSGDSGGGDTGGGDTGRGDGGADAGDAGDSGGDAGECTAEQASTAAFIASNKTCVDDADCVQVAAPCYEAQEDCCVVYMADGYDTTMWETLTTALSSCAGSGCGCCGAIPADPACNAGSCGPEAP